MRNFFEKAFDFFEKTFEIIKFIFDLVRTVLYFITWIMRIAAIGIGLFGAAFMIYEVYQLFLYFNVRTNNIPLTVLILAFILIPLSVIAQIWYYIVQIAYYLACGIGLLFDGNNDVLNELGIFFEDIQYKLIPSKRDEQVRMLGFKDMNEFEEFNKWDTRTMCIHSEADIERFRNNRNTNN